MENVNKNNIYRQEDKDILRIILVALVVIGHGTYYNITTKFGGINYGTMMSDASISDTMFHKITSILTNFIYTFHMPAFIALSGSLFSLNEYSCAVTPQVRQTGNRLSGLAGTAYASLLT